MILQFGSWRAFLGDKQSTWKQFLWFYIREGEEPPFSGRGREKSTLIIAFPIIIATDRQFLPNSTCKIPAQWIRWAPFRRMLDARRKLGLMSFRHAQGSHIGQLIHINISQASCGTLIGGCGSKKVASPNPWYFLDVTDIHKLPSGLTSRAAPKLLNLVEGNDGYW